MVKSIRTHKVRIYPTEEQKQLINHSFDVTRYAWNIALCEWNGIYSHYKQDSEHREYPNIVVIRDQFVNIFKTRYPWLREVSSSSILCAIDDLGKAWKASTRRGYRGMPKYKTKKNRKDSFRMQSCKHTDLTFVQNRLYVHKFRGNNCIKTTEFPRFKGVIKNVTISRVGNKYYAACQYEMEKPPRNQYLPYDDIQPMCGIDLGVRKLFTVDDSVKYYIDPSDRLNKRVKKLQRSLSKKVKGSNNYLKTKAKLQEKFAERANRVVSQVHEATNDLIRSYQKVAVEDLRVSNMVQNRHLSKAISESYMYEARRQLEYKSAWIRETGRVSGVIPVDPRYTSKICSSCGELNDVGSSETYRCYNCGNVMDRDYNAAINIKRRAFGV